MIVYALYRYKATADNIVWVKTDGKGTERLEPEEMPVDLVGTIEESDNGEDIFITNGSDLYLDIMQSLLYGGYNYRNDNPKMNKMRERDFKVLVGVSSGIEQAKHLYKITIKRNKHRSTIYDVSNYIKLHTQWDVTETYKCEDTPEGYATAVFIGLKSILCNVETGREFPLTIGSVSKKEWAKEVGYWFLKSTLADANKTKIDKDNEKSQTVEQFCRPAYHGGICEYSENCRSDGAGMVLDVNSMYPFVMITKPFPYGTPTYGKGEPPKWLQVGAIKGRFYYYVKIKARFKLKPDGVPCVTAKGTRTATMYEDGWLTTSDFYDRLNHQYHENKTGIVLTLTFTDFELLKNNYEIFEIEFIEYIHYKVTMKLFRSYMEPLCALKTAAKTEGEKLAYKLKLNNLSGKMAMYPDSYNMAFDIKDDLTIYEDKVKSDTKSHSYVHIGAAITAYGREILVNAIRQNKDRWIYSDTDSIHLRGLEPPCGVQVGNLTGQWKIESTFEDAVYYRKKMYVLQSKDGAKVTLAGICKATQEWCEMAVNVKYNDGFISLGGGDWPDYCPLDPMEQPEEGEAREWKEQEFYLEEAEKIGRDLSYLYYSKIPTWVNHRRSPFEIVRIKSSMKLDSYLTGVL